MYGVIQHAELWIGAEGSQFNSAVGVKSNFLRKEIVIL